MILATDDDVLARLGRPEFLDDEIVRRTGLLEEASALVEGYLGVTYTEDDVIPAVVAVVVSKMVARALTAPQVEMGDGQSLQAGPFSMSGGGNMWLSKRDKLMLRNAGGGFTSVRLSSERSW